MLNIKLEDLISSEGPLKSEYITIRVTADQRAKVAELRYSIGRQNMSELLRRCLDAAVEMGLEQVRELRGSKRAG